MAYFHCLIGGGSSGGGYELTVTCDSAFSGTTITCTDGVTTLTQTCPSSSPYEVIFEIPNGGDWTISGTVGGHTVSTGVSIPTSAELIATIQQTVTIYSAKEDTISYVDIDGATQTITFASGATSKQVTIEIEASGSSITFTSGVAKDPSDLSNYYSKTVTITSNTTSVYIMPNTNNVAYWWGYKPNNWSAIQGNSTSKSITWNTTNAVLTCGASYAYVYENSTRALTNQNTMNAIFSTAVTSGTNVSGGTIAAISSSDPINNNIGRINVSGASSMAKQSLAITNSGDVYSTIVMSNGTGAAGKITLYAMWYE